MHELKNSYFLSLYSNKMFLLKNKRKPQRNFSTSFERKGDLRHGKCVSPYIIKMGSRDPEELRNFWWCLFTFIMCMETSTLSSSNLYTQDPTMSST
jgi:hypothetical protein